MKLPHIFLSLLLLTLIPHDGHLQTLEARKQVSTGYSRIFYEDEETLRKFNRKIKYGSVNYLHAGSALYDLSVEDQVSRKIDLIIDKVKSILDMKPKNFKVDIHILKSIDKVRISYKRKYGREVEFIAFYSPIERAVYISAEEAKLKVLAHELAHAVIDQFFDVVPPEKIHELLAHHVEEQFE